MMTLVSRKIKEKEAAHYYQFINQVDLYVIPIVSEVLDVDASAEYDDKYCHESVWYCVSVLPDGAKRYCHTSVSDSALPGDVKSIVT